MEVTNKEAIAVFEDMKRGVFPFDARPYCDAAIHALHILDRDTIVQEFADKCRECGSKFGSNQPKTGYWIEETTGYSRKVYCSECKTPAIFECISMGDINSGGGSMHGKVKKTKFCPECGIKMKLQESEEEV